VRETEGINLGRVNGEGRYTESTDIPVPCKDKVLPEAVSIIGAAIRWLELETQRFEITRAKPGYATPESEPAYQNK
jgi:hypothetical protein